TAIQAQRLIQTPLIPAPAGIQSNKHGLRFLGPGSPPSRGRAEIELEYTFVLAVGLIAGAVSGIVGTGSSIMLVPVLVYQFGPKEAVPIMAVAAVMGNLARILAWWREIDWRATFAYSVTAVP